MPRRNTRRLINTANTTFHVYNRGLRKRLIFLDDADRRQFLECFRRYLGPTPQRDARGRPFRDLSTSVEVISFCLMPNHFHLVVHELKAGALAELMHAAITGYVKYFNNRHGRVGRLFESEYHSVAIREPDDLKRAIAYVHLNHQDDPQFPFSSHRWYEALPPERPAWLAVRTGLSVFGGRDNYLAYIEDELARRQQNG